MVHMNLREAIERTLAGIGSKQILETIPELAALDSWTNKSLASALCDKNNLTFKDQALLALLSQLQPSPSSSSLSLDDHERKNLEDCIAKAELPHMSRDFSAGVLVPQLTGNVVGYIAVDGPSMAESNTSNSSSNMSDASMEFLPLVGISIGHQPGPLKATLDSIFLSGLHRSRSRNDVCTDFFRHILGLWKLVFHSWFNSSQRINNTDREESMFSLEEIDHTYDKGKKRERSEEPESPQSSKRRALVKAEPESPILQEVSWEEYSVPSLPTTWPARIRQLMQQASPTFVVPTGTNLNLEATFNRNHFCTNFGAGPNIPYAGWPPKLREVHLPAGVGHDRLIALDENWNPYRPLYPCAPGLVFSFPGTDVFASRKSAKKFIDPLYTVITEVSSVRKAKTWRYCGEYRLLDLGDKSLGTLLDRKLQDKWAERIHRFSKRPPYAPAVMKISSEEPTNDVIEEAIQDGSLPLEGIFLQCVEYHDELQRKIIAMNDASDAPKWV